MENNPIFITGVERSGSSIIAKIVMKCGGYAGEISPMMENFGLKKLMDDYYTHIGADVRGQFPLPYTKSSLSYYDDWNLRVASKIDTFHNWFYKSSRLLQTWPIWHRAYPDAKWIIVRRNTEDIIQSCIKTGYMTAFKQPNFCKIVGARTEAEGWEWWIKQHELRLKEMEQRVQYFEVWPEAMVEDNFYQIYEMIQWLGLKWNDSIIPMVQPLLWKSIQKRKEK